MIRKAFGFVRRLAHFLVPGVRQDAEHSPPTQHADTHERSDAAQPLQPPPGIFFDACPPSNSDSAPIGADSPMPAQSGSATESFSSGSSDPCTTSSEILADDVYVGAVHDHRCEQLLPDVPVTRCAVFPQEFVANFHKP